MSLRMRLGLAGAVVAAIAGLAVPALADGWDGPYRHHYHYHHHHHHQYPYGYGPPPAVVYAPPPVVYAPPPTPGISIVVPLRFH